MIKSILFDADGVLINSERFSVHLARDYGIEADKTLPFFQGAFKACIVGNADLKEVIRPYLKEWGWEKSVDEFLDYWFKVEHKIDEVLFRDDTPENVKAAKQFGLQAELYTSFEDFKKKMQSYI